MNTSFEDQFKKVTSEWRSRFEEMQVQFSLGKMDAAEAFEKQKETLRQSISGMKKNIDEAAGKGETYMQEMKTKVDELMLQLNLGKAEGKDLFDEQRHKIETAMNEVKSAGKKLYDENFDKGMQLFEQNSKAFKTGLEILQLQFALGKMDAKDGAEEAKNQLKSKLGELNEMFKSAQQSGKESLENWNKQMQDGYDQFKKMAESWIKKS